MTEYGQMDYGRGMGGCLVVALVLSLVGWVAVVGKYLGALATVEWVWVLAPWWLAPAVLVPIYLGAFVAAVVRTRTDE